MKPLLAPAAFALAAAGDRSAAPNDGFAAATMTTVQPAATAGAAACVLGLGRR